MTAVILGTVCLCLTMSNAVLGYACEYVLYTHIYISSINILVIMCINDNDDSDKDFISILYFYFYDT